MSVADGADVVVAVVRAGVAYTAAVPLAVRSVVPRDERAAAAEAQVRLADHRPVAVPAVEAVVAVSVLVAQLAHPALADVCRRLAGPVGGDAVHVRGARAVDRPAPAGVVR